MPQSVKRQRPGLWSDRLIQRRGGLTLQLLWSGKYLRLSFSTYLCGVGAKHFARATEDERGAEGSRLKLTAADCAKLFSPLTAESRKRHLRTFPAAAIDADLFPPA